MIKIWKLVTVNLSFSKQVKLNFPYFYELYLLKKELLSLYMYKLPHNYVLKIPIFLFKTHMKIK